MFFPSKERVKKIGVGIGGASFFIINADSEIDIAGTELKSRFI